MRKQENTTSKFVKIIEQRCVQKVESVEIDSHAHMRIHNNSLENLL